MPDYGSVFTGKFLASPDIGDREVTVTIEKIVKEIVEDELKGPRPRWVIYFVGKEKGLLANRTNCTLIAALCDSRLTEKWVGHAITIAALDVKFGGETVKGLRIVGSPELKSPMHVQVKLPKKKPQDVTLKPTAAAKAELQPAPADARGGWGGAAPEGGK